jgi:hypothetical protein
MQTYMDLYPETALLYDRIAPKDVAKE